MIRIQKRIQYIDLIRGILMIILFLDFPWDRLFSLPASILSYNSTESKKIILFIAIVAFLITLVKYGKLGSKFKFLIHFTIATCISVTFVMLCSVFMYNEQTIIRTFSLAHHYYLVILALVFVAVFSYKNGEEKISKALNLYSFAWYILVFTQSMLYAYKGIVFFGGIDLSWTGFLSTNLLRISLISIPNFMIVYNFSVILEKKGKSLNYIQFALGMFCLLAIQQTRAYDVVIIASCIIMYTFKSRNPVRVLRNVLIACVVLIAILNTNYAQELLRSFINDSSNVKMSSNLARLYAYPYYWSCFLNNPLVGSGFAAPERYSYITNGPLGIASYSDTGIVGIIAQLGIFGLMIYGTYIIRMIYIVVMMQKKNALQYNTFCLGILCYCVATSVSLINMSVAVILLFPICIAYMEFRYYQLRMARAIEK
ncbi:O-antigen ligase family protein [Desulfosporosinus sp. OT]|uniref:O-antigen ligase family protein n=1 Tax=Desulfosporosinus sp. OT TaxID=913865 RepID=UPI000223A328|nr:O-antigen ligase family protein [Desulfosporosinus sp. OT]EGW37825.1 putative membrane protein [Desulfosporosinus sp. OT]